MLSYIFLQRDWKRYFLFARQSPGSSYNFTESLCQTRQSLPGTCHSQGQAVHTRPPVRYKESCHGRTPHPALTVSYMVHLHFLHWIKWLSYNFWWIIRFTSCRVTGFISYSSCSELQGSLVIALAVNYKTH